jgi:ubiquinone/menaquinone biosynthesis C-methylase UbiE
LSSSKNRVCPVALSGSLDNRLRKLLHNPEKLLKPYIKEGDTVIDFGCGPGFFTITMAELAGSTGKVIAADFQQGMLVIVKGKMENTQLENRVTLHKTEQHRTNIQEKADFILLFYILHELPDQKEFFTELASLTTKNARVLAVEPPFHVTKKDFRRTLETAQQAGFIVQKGPKICLSKTAILQNS